MSANLLFGTFAIIKKSSSSSWEYAADGRYWYNTICEEYNDANILDAFQYASMKHHINGCTVVDAYNKGPIIESNLQIIYFKGLNYDTRLGYGSIGGQGCFGHITYCDIPSTSISDKDLSGDGKTWYKVNEELSYPSFKNLDFKGLRINYSGFMNMYNNSSETDFKGTVNWAETNRYIVATTGVLGECKLIPYRNLG